MHRSHVKKGDQVVVTAGADKGKRGRVIAVLAFNEREAGGKDGRESKEKSAKAMAVASREERRRHRDHGSEDKPQRDPARPDLAQTPEQSEIVRSQQQETVALGEPHSGTSLGVFSQDTFAKAVSNPLVIAALAAAIALLGLAALPRTAMPDPRLNDLLVRHRTDVALAGLGALVAALAALLLA